LLHRCELRLAVLGLVLLFAQFGAITHAYSHAYPHGGAADSPRSHHSGAGRAAGGWIASQGASGALDSAGALGDLDATGASATSHDLCSDCLSFAPLLAVAGAPSPLPFMQPQGRAAGSHDSTTSRVALSPTVAFRSRAPPDVL